MGTQGDISDSDKSISPLPPSVFHKRQLLASDSDNDSDTANNGGTSSGVDLGGESDYENTEDCADMEVDSAACNKKQVFCHYFVICMSMCIRLQLQFNRNSGSLTPIIIIIPNLRLCMIFRFSPVAKWRKNK